MSWQEALKSTGVWLHGLFAAAIGGGASAIAAMTIDPSQFNFNDGLYSLLKIAGVSAVINIAFYLKKSPMPGTPG